MRFLPLRLVGGNPPPDIRNRIAAAIRESDLERVQTLLGRWPDQLRPEKLWFGTWLHHAALQPSTEIVDYFLSLGLEVNATEREGLVPLTFAAQAGQLEVAELLIERGAVLDTSSSIRNPLFAAISGSVHTNTTWPPPTGDAPKIIELLLRKGIDARIRYDMGVGREVDAVRFAWIMGARELARMIALWNSNGDKEAAQAALYEADAATKRKPK